MNRVQSLQFLADICKVADPTTCKIFEGLATAEGKIVFMEDAARWVYGQMMGNLTLSDTAINLGLNERASTLLNRVGIESLASLIPGMGGAFAAMSQRDMADAAAAKLDVYTNWAQKVAANAPWDLKEQPPLSDSTEYLYDPISRTSYRRDLWGNIHYGYLGLAWGFSEFELTNGAGVAQLKTIKNQLLKGNSKPAREALKRLADKPLPESIDPPDDQAAVDVGIGLWNEFGPGLDYDSFIAHIRKNKDRLPTR